MTVLPTYEHLNENREFTETTSEKKKSKNITQTHDNIVIERLRINAMQFSLFVHLSTRTPEHLTNCTNGMSYWISHILHFFDNIWMIQTIHHHILKLHLSMKRIHSTKIGEKKSTNNKQIEILQIHQNEWMKNMKRDFYSLLNTDHGRKLSIWWTQRRKLLCLNYLLILYRTIKKRNEWKKKMCSKNSGKVRVSSRCVFFFLPDLLLVLQCQCRFVYFLTLFVSFCFWCVYKMKWNKIDETVISHYGLWLRVHLSDDVFTHLLRIFFLLWQKSTHSL